MFNGSLFGRPLALYAAASAAVFAALTITNVVILTPAQSTAIVGAIVAVLALLAGSNAQEIAKAKDEVAATQIAAKVDEAAKPTALPAAREAVAAAKVPTNGTPTNDTPTVGKK